MHAPTVVHSQVYFEQTGVLVQASRVITLVTPAGTGAPPAGVVTWASRSKGSTFLILSSFTSWKASGLALYEC